jgi:hypothetical protein
VLFQGCVFSYPRFPFPTGHSDPSFFFARLLISIENVVTLTDAFTPENCAEVDSGGNARLK